MAATLVKRYKEQEKNSTTGPIPSTTCWHLPEKAVVEHFCWNAKMLWSTRRALPEGIESQEKLPPLRFLLPDFACSCVFIDRCNSEHPAFESDLYSLYVFIVFTCMPFTSPAASKAQACHREREREINRKIRKCLNVTVPNWKGVWALCSRQRLLKHIQPAPGCTCIIFRNAAALYSTFSRVMILFFCSLGLSLLFATFWG